MSSRPVSLRCAFTISVFIRRLIENHIGEMNKTSEDRDINGGTHDGIFESELLVGDLTVL